MEDLDTVNDSYWVPELDVGLGSQPKYSQGDKVYLKGKSYLGQVTIDSVTTEYTLFGGPTHRYTILFSSTGRSSWVRYWKYDTDHWESNVNSVLEHELTDVPDYYTSGVSSSMFYGSTGAAPVLPSPYSKTTISAPIAPKESTVLDRYNPAEPSPL